MIPSLRRTRLILRLGMPALIGLVSTTVMGIFNLIQISALGYESIAAVGIANVLMYNVYALMGSIGWALHHLIAQSFGSDDRKEMNLRLSAGVFSAGIMGAALMLCSLFLPEKLYALMGASDTVTDLGLPYLRWRMNASLLFFVSGCIAGFIRGSGNTKWPAICAILANTLNASFNYLFVSGRFGLPALGILSPGIATFSAELFHLGILAIILVRSPHFSPLLPCFRHMWLVTREGIKVGIQEMGMSGSMAVFTAVVSRLGDQALAASEIALNVLSLAYISAQGFAIAATILVGQLVGRGDAGARNTGLEVASLAGFFMALIGFMAFFFAAPIASIYTDDAVVLGLVVVLLKLAAPFQVIDGVQTVIGGALRGAGDTTFLLWSSLACGYLVFVPLVLLFTRLTDMSVIGAWLAMYLYITAMGVVFAYRYLRIDWARPTLFRS